MKKSSLVSAALIALAACFAGIGCEMHPPSETVKDYEKKQAPEQAIEKQKSLLLEQANTNSPSYFPKQ